MRIHSKVRCLGLVLGGLFLVGGFGGLGFVVEYVKRNGSRS